MTIPGGVHAVGEYAFYGAQIGEDVLFRGIVTIGEYAFANATNSEEFDVEFGEDEGLIETIYVGAHAFDDSDIDDIYIGDMYYGQGNLTVTFAEDALAGANIDKFYSALNTVPAGLADADLTDKAEIYVSSDEAVEAYSLVFPENFVEAYFRKDYPNVTLDGTVFKAE